MVIATNTNEIRRYIGRLTDMRELQRQIEERKKCSHKNDYREKDDSFIKFKKIGQQILLPFIS